MSRIGNKPILLPADVNIDIKDSHINVKGPKGELSFDFDNNLNVVVEGNELHVKRPNDSKWMKTIHGTTRALIHNMVEGVSKGFTKTLEINGVGYRAALQGNKVVLTVGYSHNVELEIPAGLKVELPKNTQINISGIDMVNSQLKLEKFVNLNHIKVKVLNIAMNIFVVRKEKLLRSS